jgi:hypothetical protein
MVRHKHPLLYYFMIPILLALLAAFLFSCSEDPTRIPEQPGDSGGLNGSGDVDPGAIGSFLLGTAADTSFAPGHIEVWANNVVFDDATGICSFDV